MNIEIRIPDKAKDILNRLHEKGFEAYVVGGCVRDSLLGKCPEDWDITTSALPKDIKNIFKKTIDTGIKHGTVTVLMDDEPFEVTTYRIDGEYEDCRRPKEVFFTSNLLEDLKRRDFTINAMAYSPENGLVDPYNGRKNLKEGIITCVGVADERFREDALRMLRAVRFGAKLNFYIDESTKQSIIRNSCLIKNVSQERIREELNKLLTSSNPNHFMDLYPLGLLEHIMPEFIPCFHVPQNNPYHAYDVATHIIKTVEAIEPKLALRWTMLLHDIGKGYTRSTDEQGIDHFYDHDRWSIDLSYKILKRLKFDNRTIKVITTLITHHDYRFDADPKSTRIALNLLGKDLFEDFIKVQRADAMGQHPAGYAKTSKKLDEILKIFKNIVETNQCTSIKELQINGQDLMSIGIKQGIEVGRILKELLDMVLDDPSQNKKETLISLAENLKKY